MDQLWCIWIMDMSLQLGLSKQFIEITWYIINRYDRYNLPLILHYKHLCNSNQLNTIFKHVFFFFIYTYPYWQVSSSKHHSDITTKGIRTSVIQEFYQKDAQKYCIHFFNCIYPFSVFLFPPYLHVYDFEI